MKKQLINSALGRREFLAATSGLLAAAVSGSEVLPHAASSEAPLPRFPTPNPSANLRQIPIGVVEPVYQHASLDASFDKVTAPGLEGMGVANGGHPNNHPCR